MTKDKQKEPQQEAQQPKPPQSNAIIKLLNLGYEQGLLVYDRTYFNGDVTNIKEYANNLYAALEIVFAGKETANILELAACIVSFYSGLVDANEEALKAYFAGIYYYRNFVYSNQEFSGEIFNAFLPDALRAELEREGENNER